MTVPATLPAEVDLTASADPVGARPVGGWFGWVIVELVSDAVLVADRARGVLLANRAAEQLFGVERDRLLGTDIDALVSNVRRGDSSGSLDGEGHHADGSTFPIDLNLHPINDSRGTLLVAVMRRKAELPW